MAIHAKSNGWLIGGKVMYESESSWIFHATDEKRQKVIAKNDPKNQVFTGINAVEDAEKWQKGLRGNK
ncbi:MAG: hypothetical protein [Bacteriophage sp.]|nr:MAG: hypothetical protein [Bacteriophage sp.]